MKRDLLPKVKKYFKTNLHTHTNMSDGKLTPDEMIENYKKAGYSVLSLTDHNVIVDHSAKSTEDFLLLTGVEVNINDEHYMPTKGFWGVTYHLNLIAKRPDNLWQPVKTVGKRATAAPYEALVTSENMPKVYDVEAMNKMIALANEKGFLVMYNHPVWSRQHAADYLPLKGLWAMELRNTTSIVEGYNENNHSVYQEMLESGMRLFPTGTDDAHSEKGLFGSWIMVGAEKLEYGSVIEALEKGDFYMSCGPEIHSLTIADGFLEIECSDVKEIFVETHARSARCARAEKGSTINSARFDLTRFFGWNRVVPQEHAFFRVTVFGADGSYAATRAYWADELKEADTGNCDVLEAYSH